MTLVKTVLSMVVRPGCESDFEKVWAAAARSISECPGNLEQTLTRVENEQRRYVIISDWLSLDALRAFESSEERRKLSAALEPLRESATKSVLAVVANFSGRDGGRS
jgi:heme-degrading monooxygenase HmoA